GLQSTSLFRRPPAPLPHALSLHDALPICPAGRHRAARPRVRVDGPVHRLRRPGRRLRRRRPRAARGAGMTAVQPARFPRPALPGRRSGASARRTHVRDGSRGDTRDTTDALVRGPAVLSYYVVGGATLLLLAIGVVMVLSASSITSIRETGTPYGYFLDQAKFALVGVPAMVVASRIPVRWYRRLAWPALGLGLVLQSLILSPLARGEKGNTNWIYIPGLGQAIQPSEFLKLALAGRAGLGRARQPHLLHRPLHVLVPGLVVSAVALGLVLAGHGLGTALVVAAVVAGAMFVAGVPLRWFGAAVVAGAGLVSFLVI